MQPSAIFRMALKKLNVVSTRTELVSLVTQPFTMENVWTSLGTFVTDALGEHFLEMTCCTSNVFVSVLTANMVTRRHLK